MRVLVAPQEFKGSLTAVEAAAAIGQGVQRVYPEAVIDSAPVADGGPGTVEAMVQTANGRTSIARVDGPLGDPVDARWGRIDNGRTAVIEMAAASGLTLLRTSDLDPRRASTYGTGQLIRHALDAEVERILIGVGGSATNDGGAGMAEALGAVLLDEQGNRLPPGGAALANLAQIRTEEFDPRVAAVEMTVLCDVHNPLLGPEGASAVYGPQKGADPACVAQLDRALANFAGVLERDLDASVADVPGAGAAGGLAAGLMAFCGATLQSGFAAVSEAVNLAQRIAEADLVLTGEDGSTPSLRTGRPWRELPRSRRRPAFPASRSPALLKVRRSYRDLRTARRRHRVGCRSMRRWLGRTSWFLQQPSGYYGAIRGRACGAR